MSKLVKYGKEVNGGDQVVVYVSEGVRLENPKVVTVESYYNPHVIDITPKATEHRGANQLYVDNAERDVWRPLVRKGDKLHVFKFEEETLESPKIVTAAEDETEENALIFTEEHILPDAISNVLDVRDTDMDEWYFYSEEAEDYPVEWYEDPVKEDRTSWVANEGGEEVSVAIDIAGNISDSYNDTEGGELYGGSMPWNDELEDEYTPMSYVDFNAARGGGMTLKEFTGVDITEDSLAFESSVDKTLKEITPESLAFEETVDMVEHPPHYNKYEREVIDSIRGLCTPDEFRGYLKGNIIKYVARYPEKGGLQDLDKTEFYRRLLREFEAEMGNE